MVCPTAAPASAKAQIAPQEPFVVFDGGSDTVRVARLTHGASRLDA
jgi:hypothetical protein